MSGLPLETCWTFNKLWNNKFYYRLYLVGISTEEEKYKLLLLGFKPRMVQTAAWSLNWLHYPDFRKNRTINKNNTGNVRLNVIVWRVWLTNLPWESNKKFVYWIWISILSYPACTFLAPCYIVICGLSGSIQFLHFW